MSFSESVTNWLKGGDFNSGSGVEQPRAMSDMEKVNEHWQKFFKTEARAHETEIREYLKEKTLSEIKRLQEQKEKIKADPSVIESFDDENHDRSPSGGQIAEEIANIEQKIKSLQSDLEKIDNGDVKDEQGYFYNEALELVRDTKIALGEARPYFYGQIQEYNDPEWQRQADPVTRDLRKKQLRHSEEVVKQLDDPNSELRKNWLTGTLRLLESDESFRRYHAELKQKEDEAVANGGNRVYPLIS